MAKQGDAVSDPDFCAPNQGCLTLRFDDVLADALELGPLRREEPELPPELTEKVKAALPKEIPAEVVCTLIRYYLANRQDDCEWVVLPVANFDAYFGDTSFSKKFLPKIPPEIMERSSLRHQPVSDHGRISAINTDSGDNLLRPVRCFLPDPENVFFVYGGSTAELLPMIYLVIIGPR